MDLTNIQNLKSLEEPIEMPVSELITGGYMFSIPSYQRGYRWESSEEEKDHTDVKQVDDLLNDLKAFADSKTNSPQANYYLQPLIVKPRIIDATNNVVWDVLDGQQRLTTMLLILSCLKEKLFQNNTFPLYSIEYENRKQLKFDKITFDKSSPSYDYPSPSENLDSYYVRKAKDRIERWYDEEIANNLQLQDDFKKMLFYEDTSRNGKPQPSLRAKFIWYNVSPIKAGAPALNGNRINDIEIFNRLNRGKISLTDSELIKALFLLCIKNLNNSGSSILNSETLVRRWDEMGKKFQNDEFWKMISPKDMEYGNRLDLLFDFIRDSNTTEKTSAYRYFYGRMKELITSPDSKEIETLWNDVQSHFDILCKWHENVQTHNRVGFLVDNGQKIAEIKKSGELNKLIKEKLNISSVNDIDGLTYKDDFQTIRKVLLLFNVLTCDKFGQRFPFNRYRDDSYDVEHVNSQTDNPIEKLEEKTDWINNHALPCLRIDGMDKDANGNSTSAADMARQLIEEGGKLLDHFKNTGQDSANKFKNYRSKVENYYASGDTNKAMANKDAIGNLTLLNSSINREYHNALFPQKLRTIKRSDQEGAYIPLCTKYMFLKYYTDIQGNASAFSMMRWREKDQIDYTKAIKDTLEPVV